MWGMSDELYKDPKDVKIIKIKSFIPLKEMLKYDSRMDEYYLASDTDYDYDFIFDNLSGKLFEVKSYSDGIFYVKIDKKLYEIHDDLVEKKYIEV